MSKISVTVQKKKRSVKRPAVEISLYRAKQFIRKSEIKIEIGECYVIYECGYVCNNKDYPQTITYYSKENRGIRSCPLCCTSKLLTKYKICICGAEHIGKRVQASTYCSSCSSLRKATGRVETLDAYKHNEHLADPSRYDCIYRNECLFQYFTYDTLPCKNCLKYKATDLRQEMLFSR